MTRLRIGLLAGLLLAAAGLACAQEDGAPPAGSWKLSLPLHEETQGRPLLIVKFDKKDSKWTGEVVASKLQKKATVEKLSVKAKSLTFTIKSADLTIACEVKLSDAKAAKLYGEATLKRDVQAMELERTTMTGLEQYDQLREMFANEPAGMRAVQIARILLGGAEEQKVKAAEVRAWADRSLKSAQMYGPNVLRDEQLLIARVLAEQTGYEPAALQYVNRAEAGLDEKAEGPAATKRVLDVLALVQEKAGKKDDAAKTQLRIKKLTFPIKATKFAGRKAKSDRIVLAELFTTSQAKSCVAAEAAIGALQKTFKASELAIILYHQHLPTGNPLGSDDGEERLSYYESDVKSLPTLILNGQVVVRGGGGPEDGQDHYETYVERIEPLLEKDSKAPLTVSAVRKGDKIDVTAEVGKLEDGEKAHLRVVLVEREMEYKGASGTPVHVNVARSMPGGYEGVAVGAKGLKKTYSVDVAALRKSLEKYQETVNKKRPFPTKDRPAMEMKNLRVIAFVQSDANKEVLQAAQVVVKAE